MIRHAKPSATWGHANSEDPGLDELGRQQAGAARDALLAIPEAFRPKKVISSPLRRCQETALPFAHALGVDLIIDPVFGEVPTPAAVGLEDRAAWLKEAFSGRWDAIRGDRDYEAWRRSIADALPSYEGCAVFSHYVAINGAVSFVTGNPMVLAFRPDHASITTFSVQDGAVSRFELGREAVTGVL
jgi:broad specificity phosphatase PhoE